MDNNRITLKMSFSLKLLFFISNFLICFFFTAIVYSLLANKFGTPDWVILSQVTLQNIVSFSLPAVVLAAFITGNPFKYLGMNVAPKAKELLFVLLLYIASIPVMNLIIYLNSNVAFPDSLSAVEQILRNYEEAAQAVTDQLISGQSFMGICVLILTVGCLTGMGEEIFFRGMLTRLFIDKPLNKHLSIWLGAIIFSFMHFQFFGFVPRVLLGAMFGYLTVWTGCLWIPIFAHALNNSVAIIANHLFENKVIENKIDVIGTPESLLWLSVISAIAVYLLLHNRQKFIQKRQTT